MSNARSGTAPQTAERFFLSQPDHFKPSIFKHAKLRLSDNATTEPHPHHRSSFTLVCLTFAPIILATITALSPATHSHTRTRAHALTLAPVHSRYTNSSETNW